MLKKLVLIFMILLICINGFTYTAEELEQYRGKKVRILPKIGLGTVGTVLNIITKKDMNQLNRKELHFIELRLMKVFGQSVIFIISAENILSIELLEK